MYFPKVLVLLFALTLTNCQKEDDYERQQTQNLKQKSTAKTISGKDVPEVLSFIRSKSNSRMQFTLDNNNSPEGQFRNHEENLSLTTTLTDQIKQVTNGFGKSNYTFKLIEEETKEGIYFLNLIVKEYRDTFYLYIVKYVPDTNWLKTSDFSLFTGTLYYYSEEGNYLLKANMIDGTSNSINSDPCPNDDDSNNDDDDDGSNEEEDDSNNENDSTGGGSGGGGDPDDPNNNNNDNNNDGGENGDNGGNGDTDWGDYGDNSDGWGDNNSDGSGSGGCTLLIITECIDHEAGGECSGTVTTHVWDCGGEYSANPTGSTRDPFSEFLRNPCTDEECESVNDCEFGWDENCECLDDPIDEEEEENDDVGVLIELPFNKNCTELQKLLDNSDIKAKLEDMQSDLFTFPNNTSEKGCSLIINSTGEIYAGDVSASTNANGSYDYDIESNRPGGAHTHPEKGLYPMFSVADIQILNSFWQTYDNPNQPINPNIPVHILVTQQGVYAIKINDLALFAVFNGSLTNDRLDLMNRKLNRAYDKHHDPVTDQYGTAFEHQKEFLKFLNNNGIGISLFKANNDLTSWSRQELDSSGNTINDRTCN